jgi:Gram-negative bacterial TonB protein C-terminal
MPSVKSFINICLPFLVATATAQTLQQDSVKANEKGFIKVETEAEFPGGNEAWKKYLEKSLQADIPIKNNAPIGKYPAAVMFVVDVDGSISNARAVTKFGYGMEDEVIRIVEKSGKWKPAIQNGKPIKAYRKQPVTFLIDNDNLSITTQEPYTLFTNTDNVITISAKKVKAADIAITVSGGKVISSKGGVFNVRVSKPGRVIIEIVNSKKDDKEIGVASFEVLSR